MPANKAFAKVQTTDRTINQLQDNIGKTVSDLQSVPINQGILLQGIDLVSGDNTIYTTLPTVLIGWFLTKKNANVDIYDKQDSNTNPATLVLNSSGTVTVDVFVF